jgi:AcrR family transcriptional regulator
MKTSKEEQAKKREAIIEAFADTAIERGNLHFSLKSIAKAAGVADATLYRYFPNKNKLLYGFYSHLIDKIKHEVEKADLSEYTFEEKIHFVTETQLDTFLPYREFIDLTFLKSFYSFGMAHKDMYLLKDSYLSIVSPMFTESVEKDEFPPLPFPSLFQDALWHLFLGMGSYWLRDDSEDFEQTTEFLDKTLTLGGTILRANILGKMGDMGSFVMKHHMQSHFFKPSMLSKVKGLKNFKNHLGGFFK